MTTTSATTTTAEDDAAEDAIFAAYRIPQPRQRYPVKGLH